MIPTTVNRYRGPHCIIITDITFCWSCFVNQQEGSDSLKYYLSLYPNLKKVRKLVDVIVEKKNYSFVGKIIISVSDKNICHAFL